MSSLSVAAVVVSHAAPEFLEKTLDALAAQTSKPEQVVVVDTAGDAQSQEIIRSRGLAMIQPGEIKFGAAIAAGVASLQHKPSWLWLLHDDSAPEPNALERLSIAAEISPSVAVIGPKLLRWEKPIEIQQMGLTLTATGRPFLLVEHEYDQGQHDNTGDTLAVSTAGMLVSLPLWEKLGGIDDSTPTFAHDLEFCMRARAAGFRVVLEASARVHHAGLAMNSKRSRGWLGGSRRTALAKAHLPRATYCLARAYPQASTDQASSKDIWPTWRLDLGMGNHWFPPGRQKKDSRVWQSQRPESVICKRKTNAQETFACV